MSGVRLNSRTARWATVLFLLLMFSVALRSARYASATYDEFVYIARGYTYLSTGETWLKVRHPILIDVLAAAPLRLLSDVRLPPADPAWATRDIYLYAYEFMWELNDHQADQIIYLSRLPIILLTLVLSAGVFRWASESAGFIAGLVSSVLCCLDPNLLAHARLVTPDAGQTTFIFLSALAWWRYLQRPTAKRWLIAGVALGVAQAAGFPALILFPVLAAASLTWGWSAGRARGALDHLVSLGGASLVALAVLWAIYGFRWGPVDGLGLSLPAPYHWEELVSLLQRLQRRDLAYCCGEVYRGGRWDFFVVALFTKTPLPTLAFCSLGVFAIVRQKRCIRDSALWMLPATYYGNALISKLNIGYRHILPILPFVFIIGGQSIGLVRARWQKIVWIGLLGWLAVASLSAHPFYLTYFNELVGGPSGGKDFLVVSDLDWGQDLPGLQVYLDERQVDEVYLSWFGTTPPEHYGIEYRPLPAWPPRGLPAQLPYHPVYPLPGAYAISAANLVGARLSQPDTFVWFRMRQPQATIGHSIYIYEVPRLLDVDAAPANVLLSGALLADLPVPVIEQRLRTNDLRPRWFDARRSMIFPVGRTVLLLGAETPMAPEFAQRFPFAAAPGESGVTADGTRYTLYDFQDGLSASQHITSAITSEVASSPQIVPDSTSLEHWRAPVSFGDTLTFLGYEDVSDTAESGSDVVMLSYWRVEQAERWPLAIFVHVLSPTGDILGQDDGLAVAPTGWYPGDVFVQLHRVTLDETPAEGPLWVQLGLYRTDTLDRLPAYSTEGDDGGAAIGDRLLLLNLGEHAREESRLSE